MGGRSPNEVMLGRKIRTTVDLVFWRGEQLRDADTHESQRAMIDRYTTDLRKEIDNVHMEVRDLRKKRVTKRQRQAKKLIMPRFEVGDYVMVARHEVHLKHKLQLRWNGPYQVMGFESEFVLRVRLMGHPDSKVIQSHIARTRRLASNKIHLSAAVIAGAVNDYGTWTVRAFLDWRFADDGSIELLTAWDGFPDDVDNTWEPLTTLVEDVSQLCRNYLQEHQEEDTALQEAYEEFFE